MDEDTYYDKIFENYHSRGKQIKEKEFNNCIFLHCDLSETDLLHNDFSDCTFCFCNLSLSRLTDTALKNVIFNDCKLVGIDFTTTRDFLFTVRFTRCLLDYTLFQKKDLSDTVFDSCTLIESNFTQADLTGALFKRCDLTKATFYHTILTKADLTTAVNFSIHPENNRLSKTRFLSTNLSGLLDTYDLIIE